VPLLLQHVSVWARHTNQVSHFEWNDWVFSRAHALLAHDAHAADDAACAHTFRPQSTWAGLMLRAADTHICLPPAAPSAPEMRLLPLPAGAAAHDGGSAQLLRLSWRAAASADMGWAADCRWLVEFAAERGGGLDVFVEEVPTGADRRVGLSVEPPAAAGGPTTYHLDLSLGKLLARLSVGRLYLWRVSLVHASFGRGAFSPPTRMALGRAADGSGAYALQCAPLASRRLHELGGAAAWRPRPFDAVRARVQMGGSQAAVGARGASRRVTFAQAVASGALQLCGDAEVAAGAIELTPMRKAVGLVGAAWSTRPVRIADGFETEFVVTCTRPADALGADGLAFVLHADPAGARALGGAGLQLGYSGLVDCIAIQLVTNPSYAGAAATAGAKGGGGDDGGDRSHEIDDEVPSELCVIESNNQVIRVPLAWSGRACIDPYTGIQFKAPSFGTRRSHRRRAHAGPGASASTSGDAAKKRSHLHNTVALQAAGARRDAHHRRNLSRGRTRALLSLHSVSPSRLSRAVALVTCSRLPAPCRLHSRPQRWAGQTRHVPTARSRARRLRTRSSTTAAPSASASSSSARALSAARTRSGAARAASMRCASSSTWRTSTTRNPTRRRVPARHPLTPRTARPRRARPLGRD
jgi:hypothetical protein